MPVKFLLFIFCVLSWGGGLASAQGTRPAAASAASAKTSPDARVAKALNDSKTSYETNPETGMYSVTYGTKKNRTQKVLIASETEEINGVEMRLVFSFAFFSSQPLPGQTANLLLQKNAETVGYWAVARLDDGKYAVINQLYVPADFAGEKLELALQAIASLADEMEEQLSKKDEN